MRGLRVAWSPTLGYARNVHPEIAAACARAVETLAALGAHVEAVDPGFDDPLEITTGLWFAGAHEPVDTLTPEQQEVADPDFAAEAELGASITMLDDAAAGHATGDARLAYAGIHGALRPAGDARRRGARLRREAGRPRGSRPKRCWVDAVLLPVQPDAAAGRSIPCGLTQDGLPIGLQIVGPMFGDALVLRAARAFEATRPSPRPL